MTELTSSQLRRAAEIKDKIESLQADLKRLLGSNEAAVGAKPSAPKRQMSAAARAKISAAAKARWAKVRADKK